MAGQIRVNTDQVAQIANEIEKLNKELNEQLNKGKSRIDSLASTWEGDASRETISSFDEFASKFFKNYEDVITQYVKFLRNNVEKGYFDTETANISLAETFK